MLGKGCCVFNLSKDILIVLPSSILSQPTKSGSVKTTILSLLYLLNSLIRCSTVIFFCF